MIVHGEVIRYIKRSSESAYCVVLLVFFRQRLRLRGFPAKFLAEAFKSAPKYNNRLTLVAPRGPKNESPVIVFSTVFSRMKHEAKLSRANFLNRHMLPSRFDAVKFIIAWKAGQKLGGQLIAFRFPKPVPISRYWFFELVRSPVRIDCFTLLLFVFLTVISGHLYCMLYSSRGDGSHESWPAAKGFLSCIGTNIALKKAERPKAPLIVLYSVVNYRSTFVILRVLSRVYSSIDSYIILFTIV